jgi:acyl carrier protein
MSFPKFPSEADMTTQQSIAERVDAIITRNMGDRIIKFKPVSNLKIDLEFDSIELIEIVMDVEDEFGIEISDYDADHIQTVQDIITYVTEKA